MGSYNLDRLLDFYQKMLLIRRFEEAAKQSYTRQKIAGFLHLYIGQEAVCVGIIDALNEADYVISSYRSHAHYLSCKGDPARGMAELYGKETGCSLGRGGSMHFFDKENHFFGGHGIVGAHIPIATGMAFAQKYKEEKGITVCFMGEGATSIGCFHEGLCLAALYNLPVLFVIENNGYAMGTPQSKQMILEDVSMRALAYPMSRKTISTNDVLEIYDEARQIVDEVVRKESRPFLLECKTYRYQGHSMADPAKYRTKDELNKHKAKDPLIILKDKISTNFSSELFRLKQIEEEVDSRIAQAVEFAESSPQPQLETLMDYTYV